MLLLLLDLKEEWRWCRSRRRTSEVVGGQHRHECRVHRVLRAEGACSPCTRAAQHASPVILDCPATAGRSNLLLFAYRLLCLQAASCVDDPAAGELFIGAYFAVLKSIMVDIIGTCASRPREAARRAAWQAWARSAAARAWHVACHVQGAGWGGVSAHTGIVHAHA